MAIEPSDTSGRSLTSARATLTLEDVQAVLEADVCAGGDLSRPVDGVGAADLMSDVLALSRPRMVLLTGLNTPQAVRTAAIADLAGVVLVRGKRPPDEMVALARELGIPLLTTPLTMFEAAGRLYVALKAGS